MVARISDDYEPQFPVVGEDLPCPAARDVVSSRVGAVRPLETVNQRSRVVGNSFRLPCSDSDDSDDDVLSVGAVRPLTTAAPPGGARMMVDMWNVEVDIVYTRRDIQNLLDVFPVMFDKAAAVPMTLPVDVEMGPQVEEDPDVVLTGRDMEMGDPDVGRDIRVLTDVCQMMFDESATGPLSLAVVVNTETQVDVRWAATLAVVPFVDGCGRPAVWLDSESDCCVMDEIVLVPEMSPIVSMKSVVVPMLLPALSEVFSLAALAGGGGGGRCCGRPLAVVETVTARVSVLPDVGSQLPMVSDASAVVLRRL